MLAIISKLKERFKGFKSLGLVLFIILIFFGMLPVSVYSVISSRLFLSSAISQRISELQSHAAIISNLVVNSGFFTNENINDLNTELNQVADVYRGRILIVDKRLTVIKDTYGFEDGKIIISKDIINTFGGTNSKYINKDSEYVELTVPIRNTEKKETIGVIFMSFPIENIYTLYRTKLQQNVTFVTVFAVILIVFSALVVKEIIKPVRTLSSSIKKITAGGDIDSHVSFSGYREFEDIAASYSGMVAELQTIDESRQEFVSNVSHELKTPITSMKVLADSLVGQEELPVELYREFMQDINTELDRMNNIINDLLTIVKSEGPSSTSIVTTVNINEFIEGLLKTLRPIAAERNIELVYETFRPITAEIDEVKLGMAFNNLIENAIKYNFDDGWVRVTLNADYKYFYLKVADSGVGIPEELQNRIFERFYRVDKARSRDTGGTGLGLAITRNAILLHRGAIKVYSKEGQGAVFTVRIPLYFQK